MIACPGKPLSFDIQSCPSGVVDDIVLLSHDETPTSRQEYVPVLSGHEKTRMLVLLLWPAQKIVSPVS